MGRFIIVFLCTLFASLSQLCAGTYTLTDGTTISGEPISFDKSGVVLKSDSGSFLPRTPWNKFSQEALKQLAAEAKRPQDKALIEPFLEEIVMEQEKKKEIRVTVPERVELPTGKTGISAMFTSPLGLLIFLLLYAANIFAAYEIAFFRYRKPLVPCLVSAVLPVIGPLIFLAMPAPTYTAATDHTHAAEAEVAPVAEEQHYVAEEQQYAPEAAVEEPSAPALPPTITFKRGEVIFNRRFFETKLANFLKTLPGEADKDMVVYVNSARGEFLARRISKLAPTELFLLTFKHEATAEEMVPYNEIYEVQIRHKDIV